jgi:hypothetical protein
MAGRRQFFDHFPRGGRDLVHEAVSGGSKFARFPAGVETKVGPRFPLARLV